MQNILDKPQSVINLPTPDIICTSGMEHQQTVDQLTMCKSFGNITRIQVSRSHSLCSLQNSNSQIDSLSRSQYKFRLGSVINHIFNLTSHQKKLKCGSFCQFWALLFWWLHKTMSRPMVSTCIFIFYYRVCTKKNPAD